MAFPTVQDRGTGSANAGALVVVIPGVHGTGDLIFIVMKANSTSTTWTQTSGTTGWTELHDLNGITLQWKVIGASESDPSFDLSTSERSAFVALRITGQGDQGVQPPERGSQFTGTSTAPNSGGLSPTGGAQDYLWLACAAYGDGRASFTLPPSGYSPLVSVGTGGAASGVSVATAELQLNAANENPGAFTNTRNDFWQAYTVVIHPVSAAVTVGRGLTNSPLLGGKVRRLVG